jgi:2-polyprenyl-6-methoxyphenol hydroxylase-like FAD-dependent oxidoreductase
LQIWGVETMKQCNSAIVVGASLAGLMTALSLAQVGVHVTVLERADEVQRRGATLSVSGGERDNHPIAKRLRAIASGGEHGVESWRAIQKRLRDAVAKERLIEIYYNTKVTKVGQDEQKAFALTESGIEFHADIVIGADGGRSIVRQEVNPGLPYSTFAGYLLWVAIVEENELPVSARPNAYIPSFNMIDSQGQDFLFGMVAPGMNGSRKVGERQLGLAWYDNTFNHLLYQSGAVEGTVVKHSLSGNEIPQEAYDILLKRANKYFPQPWRAATQLAINKNYLVATPVSEYVATKLVNGRLAIVGDAAHALTPMTALGFNSSLEDAATIGMLVEQNGLDSENVNETLAEYEHLRLGIVRRIVQSGQSFSRSFAR